MDQRTLTISTLLTAETAVAARHLVSVEEFLTALNEYEPRVTKDGPAWSPIAWAGDKRSSALAESVSALVYDLDDAPAARVVALGEVLEALDWVYAIHETYTAGRYRLALPLAVDLRPSEYLGAWQRTALDLGIADIVDTSGKDLARLFYTPSHPPGEARSAGSGGSKLLHFEAAQAPQAPKIEPLKTQETFDLAKMRVAARALSNQETRGLVQQAIDATLHLKKGSRDNTLHLLMSALAYLTVDDNPVSEESAMAVVEPTLASMEGADDDDWRERARHSFRRAAQRREQSDAERAKVAGFFKPSPTTSVAVVPDDAWKARLGTIEVKGVTRLENHTANLELLFENDPSFAGTIRFNELKRRIEVSSGPLVGCSEDTMDTQLSNYLFPPPWNSRISRDTCGAAILHHAMRHKYDPVREYLTNLPAWDGVRRIDDVLLKYAGADGNREYLRMITRKFFISAVARALDPGCQVDTVLVLLGEQGGGKTSFVRCLGAGFSVETRLDIHNKDSVMIATANWLVELSELAALRKSDVESVRAFITTKEDQIRLPYGRAVTTLPRRCVFIGTTNSKTPLVDPEGNRRFWVVAVGTVDVVALAAVREQLWAEARAAYLRGEPWWLDKVQAQVAAVEAQVYQSENVIEEQFGAWIHDLRVKPDYVTVTDVATGCLKMLGHQITPQVQSQISRTLGNLGWTKRRKRIDGMVKWVYIRPDYENVSTEEEESNG